jgi:hypothetical protein
MHNPTRNIFRPALIYGLFMLFLSGHADCCLAQDLKAGEPTLDSRSSSPAIPLLNCSITHESEQIYWTNWHKQFHEAVMVNQAALLKQNKSIRYGLAVVEFTVTNDRHITAHAFAHDSSTYLKFAQEALSGYHMSPTRQAVFMSENPKFDELVVRCYEKLDGKKILAFPPSSTRTQVTDTRWHLAGAGVGNYVHWPTDDFEQTSGE